MKVVERASVVLDGYIVYCPHCKTRIYIEYDEYNEIEEILINTSGGEYVKMATCPHCQKMFGFDKPDDRVYHTEVVFEENNNEEKT